MELVSTDTSSPPHTKPSFMSHEVRADPELIGFGHSAMSSPYLLSTIFYYCRQTHILERSRDLSEWLNSFQLGLEFTARNLDVISCLRAQPITIGQAEETAEP